MNWFSNFINRCASNTFDHKITTLQVGTHPYCMETLYEKNGKYYLIDRSWSGDAIITPYNKKEHGEIVRK